MGLVGGVAIGMIWWCARREAPPVDSGTYRLSWRRSFSPTGTVKYEIGSPQGRQAVAKWIDLHRERMPTGRAGFAIFPRYRLSWTDGQRRIGYALYISLPSPGSWRCYFGEQDWIGKIPLEELERLRRIFKQYGRVGSSEPSAPR